MKTYSDEPYDDLFEGTGPSKHQFKSCFETHPKLELGGGTFIGGSCSRPVSSKADIYIGFDRSMSVRETYPWARQPVQVLYPITDMHAPSDPESFIKLIDWSAEQLAMGKVLHAGCIGGHGRTGTFLAALWAVVKNEKDCIDAMRKAYCHKAVESHSQVKFLNKHFGIKEVSGAKEGKAKGGTWHGYDQYSGSNVSKFPKSTGGKEWKNQKPVANAQFKNAQAVFNPVKSESCLWGSVF